MRHQITQWGHEAWVGPDGVHFSDYGSLEELARTAPHDCDVPGCPGPLNQRKLEVFPDLLAALAAISDAWSNKRSLSWQPDGHHQLLEQARAAITNATGHGLAVLEADAARMDPAGTVAADAGRLAEAETAQEAARSPQAR